MSEWIKILADYGLSGVLAICIVYLVKNIKHSNGNGKIDSLTDISKDQQYKLDSISKCLQDVSNDLKQLSNDIRIYAKETSNLSSKIEILVKLMDVKNG